MQSWTRELRETAPRPCQTQLQHLLWVSIARRDLTWSEQQWRADDCGATDASLPRYRCPRGQTQPRRLNRSTGRTIPCAHGEPRDFAPTEETAPCPEPPHKLLRP